MTPVYLTLYFFSFAKLSRHGIAQNIGEIFNNLTSLTTLDLSKQKFNWRSTKFTRFNIEHFNISCAEQSMDGYQRSFFPYLLFVSRFSQCKDNDALSLQEDNFVEAVSNIVIARSSLISITFVYLRDNLLSSLEVKILKLVKVLRVSFCLFPLTSRMVDLSVNGYNHGYRNNSVELALISEDDASNLMKQMNCMLMEMAAE
ncbi:hypothetical protein Tco_0005002 [Tanacetum coccineum]